MVEQIQSSDIDIRIEKLSEKDYNQLTSFSCGCDELDKFFHDELELCVKYKYFSSYCAKDTQKNEIIALFTLANDTVVIGLLEDKDDFIDEMKGIIDDEYAETFERQTSFPAVNIGHLGVRSDYQSKGIGRQIIDFVLYTFSHYDISGCQFITIDSLNNPRTNKFYLNNGFVNQTNSDMNSDTRRMYLPISFI